MKSSKKEIQIADELERVDCTKMESIEKVFIIAESAGRMLQIRQEEGKFQRTSTISIQHLYKIIKPQFQSSLTAFQDVVDCLRAIERLLCLEWSTISEDELSRCERQLNSIATIISALQPKYPVLLEISKQVSFLFVEVNKRKRIETMPKVSMRRENSIHPEDQEIKSEMIDLVEQFKMKAKQMQKGLKKDEEVINSIKNKQNSTESFIEREKNKIFDIMNIKGVGFFRLLTMALAGLVLWIYGIFFIVIS